MSFPGNISAEKLGELGFYLTPVTLAYWVSLESYHPSLGRCLLLGKASGFHETPVRPLPVLQPSIRAGPELPGGCKMALDLGWNPA